MSAYSSGSFHCRISFSGSGMACSMGASKELGMGSEIAELGTVEDCVDELEAILSTLDRLCRSRDADACRPLRLAAALIAQAKSSLDDPKPSDT